MFPLGHNVQLYILRMKVFKMSPTLEGYSELQPNLAGWDSKSTRTVY
jgi:hypothetical protein